MSEPRSHPLFIGSNLDVEPFSCSTLTRRTLPWVDPIPGVPQEPDAEKCKRSNADKGSMPKSEVRGAKWALPEHPALDLQLQARRAKCRCPG
jgi:hypothetical protein